MEGLIMDFSPSMTPEDDEENYDSILEKINSSEDTIDNEGRVVSRRQIKEIYLPDDEIEKIYDSYEYSCVSDFEDIYHKSEKEKREENEFYDIFKDYETYHKPKTRKLDEFVYQYRYVLHLLDEVAKRNGVYDPEEFKIMVIKKKINVYGIDFPKYNGSAKQKKSINWDYVTEVIFDESKDPSILMKQKESFVVEEETNEETEEILKENIGEENYNEIFKDEDTLKESLQTGKMLQTGFIKNKDIPVLLKNSNFQQIMTTIRKKNLRGQRINDYSREMIYDDIDYIEEHDKRLKIKDSEIPNFHGDINKKSNMERYNMEIEDYLDTHEFVDYHGRFIKKTDYDDLIVKESLDEAGWDLKKVFNYEAESKALKKQAKRDKKRRDKLQRRLKAIDDRKAIREGKYTGEITKGKKKKNKKVKKKNKKRVKMAEGLMMDSAGVSENMTWKDWEREMSDFTSLH